MTEHNHIPVMLPEILEALGNVKGQTIIDATFGRGGYSSALLEGGASIVAIDRDPEAIAFSNGLKKKYPNNFIALQGRFSEIDKLAQNHAEQVDAVVFDLGVSSPQLDDDSRGFSFRYDSPLDMRMEKQGKTAADIVNSADEAELKMIFKKYGEEPKASKISKAIIKYRTEKAPITTTKQLAELVESISPPRYKMKKHPATRVFQALRIAVNNELQELQDGLSVAVTLLSDGGKIAVVSFHSLEDRIVKQFFASLSKQSNPSRHAPPTQEIELGFKQHGKAIVPSAESISQNPRCRSAKLRVLEKLKTQSSEATQ